MNAHAPTFDELETGTVVAEQSLTLTRDSLVRYAGASGDFNPIHYRDDIAESVGLPGVLAHGMLTMGVAVQPLLEWLQSQATLTDYQVRFTRPVVVDPQHGAELHITTIVGPIDTETRSVRFDLTVKFDGETVLGKAQVRATFA